MILRDIAAEIDKTARAVAAARALVDALPKCAICRTKPATRTSWRSSTCDDCKPTDKSHALSYAAALRVFLGEPPRLNEACPKCGASLVHGDGGSGVKCPKCRWWHCT